MKPVVAVTLVVFAAIALADASNASVQPTMYCWDPDSEFPVSCNEEGEEDEARAAVVEQFALWRERSLHQRVSWRQRPGATP